MNIRISFSLTSIWLYILKYLQYLAELKVCPEYHQSNSLKVTILEDDRLDDDQTKNYNPQKLTIGILRKFSTVNSVPFCTSLPNPPPLISSSTSYLFMFDTIISFL